MSSAVAHDQDQGRLTGTGDTTYDLMWFTQACLDNVTRLKTYCDDANKSGDTELAEFFERAQNDSRKGAEQAKELLTARLTR